MEMDLLAVEMVRPGAPGRHNSTQGCYPVGSQLAALLNWKGQKTMLLVFMPGLPNLKAVYYSVWVYVGGGDILLYSLQCLE